MGSRVHRSCRATKSSGFIVDANLSTISGGGLCSRSFAKRIQDARCSASRAFTSAPSSSNTHPNHSVESMRWRCRGLARVGSSATPTGGKYGFSAPRSSREGGTNVSGMTMSVAPPPSSMRARARAGAPPRGGAAREDGGWRNTIRLPPRSAWRAAGARAGARGGDQRLERGVRRGERHRGRRSGGRRARGVAGRRRGRADARGGLEITGDASTRDVPCWCPLRKMPRCHARRGRVGRRRRPVGGVARRASETTSGAFANGGVSCRGAGLRGSVWRAPARTKKEDSQL